MPQLDLMHFFSQFFWFSFFFIFLFFYTSLNILPLLVRVLKYRNKKLIFLSLAISNSKKSVFSLCFFHDNIISSSFQFINKKILNLITFCTGLIDKKLQIISINLFHTSNKNYFVFLILNTYKNFVFEKKINNEL